MIVPAEENVLANQPRTNSGMENTFIDCLPDELQVKIARDLLVQPIESLTNALNFAQLCEKKEDIVREGLRFALDYSDDNPDMFSAQMVSLLGQNARFLCCINQENRKIPNVINKHCLSSAMISSQRETLNFISGARNIITLLIIWNNAVEWKTILAVLKSLPLEYLSICWMNNMNDAINNQDLLELAEACPNVKGMTLHGHNWKRCHLDLWAMLKQMPLLESLVCPGHLTKDVIPFLQGMDSVCLDGETTVAEASIIGSPMTSVRQLHPASLESLQNLKSCPFLQHVELHLQKGAEKGLLGVVSNLHILTLRWGKRYTTEDLGLGVPLPDFYEPDAKTLIRIAEQSPDLRELELDAAIFPINAVFKILQTVRELRVFRILVDKKGECFASRLTLVMEAAAKYTRKIVKLSPFDEQFIFHRTIIISPALRRRCWTAFRLLKKRAAEFDQSLVQEILESFHSFEAAEEDAAD